MKVQDWTVLRHCSPSALSRSSCGLKCPACLSPPGRPVACAKHGDGQHAEIAPAGRNMHKNQIAHRPRSQARHDLTGESMRTQAETMTTQPTTDPDSWNPWETLAPPRVSAHTQHNVEADSLIYPGRPLPQGSTNPDPACRCPAPPR